MGFGGFEVHTTKEKLVRRYIQKKIDKIILQQND